MFKITSLSAAIPTQVHDGDCIFAAGFTHLILFAAGYEIMPDLVYDRMVAAGCACKVIFSYLRREPDPEGVYLSLPMDYRPQ